MASVAIRGIGGEWPLLDRHAEHSRTVTIRTMATAKVAAQVNRCHPSSRRAANSRCSVPCHSPNRQGEHR